MLSRPASGPFPHRHREYIANRGLVQRVASEPLTVVSYLVADVDHLPPKHRVRRSAQIESAHRDGAQVAWAFGGDEFETRFDAVGRITIPRRSSFELNSTDEFEWCVVPLSRGLRYEGPNEQFDLTPRAVVLTAHGPGDHNLVNNTRKPAVALLGRVELGEELDRRPSGYKGRLGKLDRSLLTPFEAHMGLGEIQFRSVFDRRSSAWNSIDHVLLPPGTSVGLHRNHNIEEVFVILEGRGTMLIESEVVEVAREDCIFNPLGGSHGIINPHETTLELLNLSVPMGNDPPEVTDLAESLSDLVDG